LFVAKYEHLSEPGRQPTLAERAAWTMVANVVLNLDETLSKE